MAQEAHQGVTTQESLYGESTGGPGWEEASPPSRVPPLEITRRQSPHHLQTSQETKSWDNACQMSDHERTSHTKTVLSVMPDCLGPNPGGRRNGKTKGENREAAQPDYSPDSSPDLVFLGLK